MESRRKFLQTSAMAALASGSALGANDTIRLGLIGCGRRGGQIRNSIARHSDCVFTTACDVDQSRLEKAASAIGGDVATYTDYRRVLESKDVDAVIIATPDHWHAPMFVSACEAGKDIYVEKPVSNTVAPAWEMVKAAKKYNRVVQVGTQQRSWPHFQECAKKVQDGQLGQINHCVLLMFGAGGRRNRRSSGSGTPPEGLDWEAWQGPAERHPYSRSRQRGWRSYYDYGGGSMPDWGAHFTDAMIWYMQADRTGPALTSAMGQYIYSEPDPAVAPDTYSVTWKYEKFIGTFTNASLPSRDPQMVRSDAYGNYFYGENGVLHVNRYGYEVMLNPQSRRGADSIKPERVMDPNGLSEGPESNFAHATIAHGRNFLDCIKSRKQPVCDMEIGFYSSLPVLLAVMSIRQGRTFTWDGTAAKAV